MAMIHAKDVFLRDTDELETESSPQATECTSKVEEIVCPRARD
jgi:hypothetical protein